MMSILLGVANFLVPVEFVLFVLTLIGVAIFHHHTLRVSLIGLGVIILYEFFSRDPQPGRASAVCGVALSNMYPESRSVGQWFRHGWAIPLSYIVGFFVMLVAWGWRPLGH